MARSKLKILRQELDLTQMQIASLLGITQSFWSYLERGKREPSEQLKKKIDELMKEVSN